MTLSTHIYHARKRYRCDSCNNIIKIGDKYVRCFGSSDENMKNPPPYMVRMCSKCAERTIALLEVRKDDRKI